MKFASFDLETATIIPRDASNLWDYAPLGISCGAVALSGTEVRFWHNKGKLTKAECKQVVRDLQGLARQGWTLVTWNGCGFDFRLLAEESGLRKECADLALQHVDLMLLVTFKKGWYLSLQKALLGAGLAGKRKKVLLSTGVELRDMAGPRAPELWDAGEYEAVLSYLQNDVIQTLELACRISEQGAIRWTSNRGYPQRVGVGRMFTVQQCYSLPKPDVSWMDAPPSRDQFVEWIPENMRPAVIHKSL